MLIGLSKPDSSNQEVLDKNNPSLYFNILVFDTATLASSECFARKAPSLFVISMESFLMNEFSEDSRSKGLENQSKFVPSFFYL